MTLQEVIKTRNVELIKDYYLKNNDVEYLDMIELIIKTEDIEFIKQCIEDVELVDTSFERIELIEATKDIEYIKKCLKDSRFDFDLYDQMTLIKGTKNTNFIKSCLESHEFNWGISQKASLLIESKDIRYIKEALENDSFDLGENKYLVEERLPYIIENMDDINGIKKIIEDKEIRSDKNLIKNEAIIATLILRTKDIEYIKECINNQELGLSESSKFTLLTLCESTEFIEERFGNKQCKRIKLPERMTAGMEIESVGNNSMLIIEGFSYGDWESKYEHDLQRSGCEVISPPMTSNEEYSQQIYTVNNMLVGLGQSVSVRCGGHIHVGADYLKSIQAYDNLKDIYCATEKILYAITNEKGSIPRLGILENAVMLTDEMKRLIGDKSFDLVDENQLNKFIQAWKMSQIEMAGRQRAYDGRSTGLNMLNVNNVKNTIEFRFPNGTLNPEMWIDNINLLGGIVAVSQELAEIQEKGAKTQEDENKLEIFAGLKKTTKSGKEKLELLLELTGLEPEEYIERYKVNIELIKKDFVMSKVFGLEEETKKFNSALGISDIATVTGSISAIQQQIAEEKIIESYEKNEKSKTINR